MRIKTKIEHFLRNLTIIVQLQSRAIVTLSARLLKIYFGHFGEISARMSLEKFLLNVEPASQLLVIGSARMLLAKCLLEANQKCSVKILTGGSSGMLLAKCLLEVLRRGFARMLDVQTASKSLARCSDC